MKHLLLVIFFFKSLLLFSQIPQTNLIGHWTGGIIVSGTDTIILIGSDTVKLTNVDWPIDSGYIPLRTVATFKMKSINNTVDTGFWNHDVPPCVTYQDIDYSHQTFFKIDDQELNADSTEKAETRITECAIYSIAQTGTNLTTLNTWFAVPTENATAKWVSKTGSDVTGNGSKANPWLTIEKAYKTVTTGTTLYIKSGEYTESYGGGINYIFMDRAITCTFSGLGRVRITNAGDATFVIRVIAGFIFTFNRIIINASGVANAFSTYTGTSLTLNLNNIRVDGSTLRACNGLINDNYIITNCVFNKGIYTTGLCSVNGSIVSGVVQNATTFNYNKTTNVYLSITTSSITNINYNSFIFDTPLNAGVNSNNITLYSSGALTIKYNLFSMPINASQNCVAQINITNTTTPVIEYNRFITLTTNAVYNLSVSATNVIGKVIFRYNYIKSNSTSSVSISIGNETTEEAKLNTSEIYGNYMIGSLYDYPSTASTCHGYLLNAGVNMVFKNNYVSYCGLALAIKTGKGNTYTSNGVWSNIFANNGRDIYARKIKGLSINNNTFYNYAAGIYIDDFDGYYSENVLINNCLFYSTRSSYSVLMDQHSADNGCKIYNSILPIATYSMYIETPLSLTFVQAVATNYFIDCLNQNITFVSSTELWPIPAITGGADLGTNYQYALATSTTWGSATQVPTIVLKNQGTIWDIGAYKVSGNFIKMQSKKIIKANNKISIIR